MLQQKSGKTTGFVVSHGNTSLEKGWTSAISKAEVALEVAEYTFDSLQKIWRNQLHRPKVRRYTLSSDLDDLGSNWFVFSVDSRWIHGDL